VDIVDILNRYGFATLAAIGMGWFIYFIYIYITTQIKVKLGEMNGVLIQLIDKIRMLDNDLIRLRSKLNTVLTLREQEKREKKENSKE
jgi:type II secretory pathway component PulF